MILCKSCSFSCFVSAIIKQVKKGVKSYFNVADVNECGLNNAGCEHVCNNTAGSFNCDCRAGFKLKTDKRGCEGMN